MKTIYEFNVEDEVVDNLTHLYESAELENNPSIEIEFRSGLSHGSSAPHGYFVITYDDDSRTNFVSTEYGNYEDYNMCFAVGSEYAKYLHEKYPNISVTVDKTRYEGLVEIRKGRKRLNEIVGRV